MIRYNLDPLSALELFYDGEHHGVYKGDFIKNEKKNGLILPPMLREFLENFGYLSVNEGRDYGYKIFHPDNMANITLPSDDGEEVHLIVIGILKTVDRETEEEELFFVGVRPDTPEFQIGMGQKTDDGMEWWGTGRTLSGLLTLMFCSLLYSCEDNYVYEDLAGISGALRRYKADLQRVAFRGEWVSVHFDEESGAFITVEYNEETGEVIGVHVVPRKAPGEDKAKNLASLSLEELEEIFGMEFYANSLNCDYAHALDVLTEITKRMEQNGADETEFVEKRLLAGRCCWALGRLDEAEAHYNKGLEIAERHIEEDHKPAFDICDAMSSFYGGTGRPEKGAEFSEKAKAILEKYDSGNVYAFGMIYRDRAMELEGDDGRLDELIELCEKALEFFQKDPHDPGCKYEIARVQQLRGNARRRKKELAKQGK